MLVRDHIGYNEIDTGYIVRAKSYDDGNPPYFEARTQMQRAGAVTTIDVIAWGCRRRSEDPTSIRAKAPRKRRPTANAAARRRA